MQRLDPRRFPGNPIMVEQLHAEVLSGVDNWNSNSAMIQTANPGKCVPRKSLKSRPAMRKQLRTITVASAKARNDSTCRGNP